MLIAIAIAEEIQELQSFEILSFLWLWQKVWVVLVWTGINHGGVLAQVWDLVILGMEATTEPEENMDSCGALSPRSFSSNQCKSNFLPKSKKTLKLKTSMQSFVILGSLLQWRWQWASIGHFVFLFLCHWVVHIWNCGSNKHTAESLPWKEHLPIVQLLGQSQVRIQDLYFPACGQLEKLRVAYQSIHRSPW